MWNVNPILQGVIFGIAIVFALAPWRERRELKRNFFCIHKIHRGIFFEKFRPLNFLASKAAAFQWCIHESTAQVFPIQPTIPAIYEQLWMAWAFLGKVSRKSEYFEILDMRTIRPKLPEIKFELSGDFWKKNDNYQYSNLGVAVASWLVSTSLANCWENLTNFKLLEVVSLWEIVQEVFSWPA